MYLDEAEQAMVLAMRAAVEAEVRTLTDCLEHLEAENRILIKALNNHGICLP